MKGKYIVFGVTFSMIVLGIGYYYTTQILPYRGWKTYRNEEVGYSVKYPESYFLERSIFGNELDAINIQDTNALASSMDVYVTVYENPKLLSAEQWARQYKSYSLTFLEGVGTQREVHIGNLQGLWLEVGDPKDIDAAITVLVVKNNKTFDLFGVVRSWAFPEGNYRAIVEQILYSLRVD